MYRDADGKIKSKGPLGENWSGEATRGGGFRLDEQRVDVTIGDNAVVKKGEVRKEAPIWMRESTVDNEVATTSSEIVAGPAIIDEVKPEISNFLILSVFLAIFPFSKMEIASQTTEKNRNQEDIMSVLMELEKQSTKAAVPGDSSDDEAAARSLLEQITPATDTVQRQVQYDSKDDLCNVIAVHVVGISLIYLLCRRRGVDG